MLVLTRKSEESVVIGNEIEVKVLAVRGDQVSLGFSAPDAISIYRKEVYEAIQNENRQAVQRGVSDINLAHFQISSAMMRNKKPVKPEGRDAVGR